MHKHPYKHSFLDVEEQKVYYKVTKKNTWWRSLELQPKQQATWQCVLHQHTAHKAAAASKDSHRTLAGHIRTLRTQVQQNYNTRLPTTHPIMAWAVRHSAYLINRFLIRADGYSSYHKRWGRTHNAALCEFGETVMYMVQSIKQRPKLEPRFYKGIWLGKCTSTGESFIGIAGRLVHSRTIRGLAGTNRYDAQLMDTITGTPWNPTPPTGFQPAFIPFILPPTPAPTEQQVQAGQIPQEETEYRQSTNNSNKACYQHKGSRNRSKESKNRDNKETKSRRTTAKHSFSNNVNTLYSNEVWNITNANRFTNQTSGRPSTWRKCKQEQKAKYNTGSTNETRRDKGKRQYKTKIENQCSYSCIEEWQEDYNSNKWRPTGGTSRTEATRASHLQQWRIRYREVEARNAKGDGIHENTRSVWWDRCYKAYTSTKTRTWSRQHHRVKMGLQIQRRWSTSKDRSKRVHRTHRRPRWCVRKYTTLCSAKDTPSTQHGQRMDCTGRWHIYRLLTRTRSNSRLGTQTTKGVLYQSKHPLEATQSNVRPTKQPERMAGALSKSAYRHRSKKTTIRAQCLHQWHSLHHGLRWRPSLYRRTWWGGSNFQDIGQDVASPCRHLHNKQHNWLPWQTDYKQRRPLWSLFGKQLHRQHPTRSKPTKCNSSRHYRFQ